jgi:hypothetical protein
MDYFPRKSLSKYSTDRIDFNKHVHDIDKWRKYAGGDIGPSNMRPACVVRKCSVVLANLDF